jgi:hypothetical protein
MDYEELRKEFKDVTGRWRTSTLFEETCDDPAKYPPVYTLKDSDTSSCVSLKERYLEMGDITEYDFANLYLGGWEHWSRVAESYLLKPHVEEWREQLALKLRAEALRKIKEMAEGEGPSAFNAAKFLLDEVGGKERKPKRGRPSKEEKEGFLKGEHRDAAAIANDAARIGIKVIK